MQCFVRLLRLLLGPDAVSDDKTEWGLTLCILGVDISMSERGFQFRPSREKCLRWRACIETALAESRLLPGAASKLAGRLSWACSQLFHRFGRATLRALFDQRTLRCGSMSPELRRCLKWWLCVLALDLAELRPWVRQTSRVVHLFCDAAGNPPHLGAVLVVGTRWYWTHCGVDSEVLGHFKRRRDSQIMGLELLSITLGFCTFASQLKGRRVIVHSDNTGSEACVRRGSARSMDHAQLVHAQWTQAAVLAMSVFVKRVATDVNIADLPSRLELEAMRALPWATEVAPVLDSGFCAADSWEELQERWRL